MTMYIYIHNMCEIKKNPLHFLKNHTVISKKKRAFLSTYLVSVFVLLY